MTKTRGGKPNSKTYVLYFRTTNSMLYCAAEGLTMTEVREATSVLRTDPKIRNIFFRTGKIVPGNPVRALVTGFNLGGTRAAYARLKEIGFVTPSTGGMVSVRGKKVRGMTGALSEFATQNSDGDWIVNSLSIAAQNSKGDWAVKVPTAAR